MWSLRIFTDYANYPIMFESESAARAAVKQINDNGFWIESAGNVELPFKTPAWISPNRILWIELHYTP